MPEQPFDCPYRTAADLGTILRRIDLRLRALGLSERAASMAAGLSSSQIRTMRRQYRLGTQHGASIRTIDRLAQVLKTTPEWLTSGAGSSEADGHEAVALRDRPRCIPLAGRVAAGSWIEDLADDERQLSRVPPDPRHPARDQSAYEVQGNAIDRFACDGDFLITVRRPGWTPRSGEVVIVRRKKGDLREITARRLEMNGSEIELRYDSNSPKYNESPPLRVRPGNVEGDTEIVIGGLVVAVYRPLT
jgi:SOS-response transcriptional repressor LexA